MLMRAVLWVSGLPLVRWLRRRLGRSGTILLCLAVVWSVAGLRVMFQPDPDPGFRLPLEYLPVWVRVGIWFAAAAVALVTAWWPPNRTVWGYVALVIPAGFRAISYAAAAALGQGDLDMLLAAATWWAIAVLVIVLAGWDENHE